MRKEELISIIIPIFNMSKYLEKCIDSVINQTYKNLEIILIDDGSTDNSGEICDRYLQKDNRIKVVHQKNQGVSAARNEGLKHATGYYIGFVDPDDFIESKMYEIIINDIKENQCDIGICGIRSKNEDDITLKEDRKQENIVMNKKEFLNILIQDKMIATSVWDKVFKSELIKEKRFNEKRVVGEDFELILEVINNKKIKAVYNSSCLYNYLIREKSASRKQDDKQAIDILEVNDNLLKIVQIEYPDLQDLVIERILKKENMILKKYRISQKIKEKIKIDIRIKEKIYFKSKYIPLKNKVKYILKRII